MTDELIKTGLVILSTNFARTLSSLILYGSLFSESTTLMLTRQCRLVRCGASSYCNAFVFLIPISGPKVSSPSHRTGLTISA